MSILAITVWGWVGIVAVAYFGAVAVLCVFMGVCKQADTEAERICRVMERELDYADNNPHLQTSKDDYARFPQSAA